MNRLSLNLRNKNNIIMYYINIHEGINVNYKYNILVDLEEKKLIPGQYLDSEIV